MWRRRHLDDEASLDRRRRDLGVRNRPNRTQDLEGTFRTDNLNAQLTTSHIFHQHRGVKLAHLGRGIEAPHVRPTPLQGHERPITAMDFAVREARADDGGVDDDLGTFLGIVDSSTRCTRAKASETKRDHRLPCKLSGRLPEKLVCWEVQTPLRLRTVDHGGGRNN